MWGVAAGPRVATTTGDLYQEAQAINAHLLFLPKKPDLQFPRNPACLEGSPKGEEEGLDSLLDMLEDLH